MTKTTDKKKGGLSRRDLMAASAAGALVAGTVAGSEVLPIDFVNAAK
ncbi:MAG: twin-arginine translocation signal domain-containing protein, partial [Hyphomicrobiales bacterium]